jgi:hypothetical protein
MRRRQLPVMVKFLFPKVPAQHRQSMLAGSAAVRVHNPGGGKASPQLTPPAIVKILIK